MEWILPHWREYLQSSEVAGLVELVTPPVKKTLQSYAYIVPVILKGHFRVPKNLTFKARLSAKPLIWKWVLIMMQIKLIFTTKVSHLASFWEWDFLELGSGLFARCSNMIKIKGLTGPTRLWPEKSFSLSHRGITFTWLISLSRYNNFQIVYFFLQ